MSPRSDVSKREKAARDSLKEVAGSLDTLLADVDGVLTTASVDQALLDSLDGALYAGECNPHGPCDHHDWEDNAMRWAPPPGPGEEDPFEDPAATERFRARVRNPAYRPSLLRGNTRGVHPLLVILDEANGADNLLRNPAFVSSRDALPGPLAHFSIQPGGGWQINAAERMAFTARPPIVMTGDINAPEARALYRVLMRAFQGVADAFKPMLDAFRKIGRALERRLPSQPPDDQRERALYMTRTRSTGPAREPFRHRGGMTRDRVPERRRLRGRGEGRSSSPRDRG